MTQVKPFVFGIRKRCRCYGDDCSMIWNIGIFSDRLLIEQCVDLNMGDDKSYYCPIKRMFDEIN